MTRCRPLHERLNAGRHDAGTMCGRAWSHPRNRVGAQRAHGRGKTDRHSISRNGAIHSKMAAGVHPFAAECTHGGQVTALPGHGLTTAVHTPRNGATLVKAKVTSPRSQKVRCIV